MQWTDEGIVLGVRRHGETSVILELLTLARGRHLGLVRGGRSTRLHGALQPGNSLGLVWRARLDEHLGAYAVEPLALRAGRLIASGLALAGVGYLGALMRLLPERDPHETLFEAVALIARFEAQVLAECGFSLDLERCAATGAREDLVYVSPKSGRAVSAAAGARWKERLLPLPAFLRPGAPAPAPGAAEVADAFRLTGFFLTRDLFAPRGLPLPDSRRAFLAAAAKEGASMSASSTPSQ